VSEYEDPRLYNDGTGRGAKLGTLDGAAAMNYAGRNMASLSPAGAGAEEEEDTDEELNEDSESEMEQLEVDISDTLNALFESTEASPEFVEKFKVVFEAALSEKVSLIEQAILEASKEIIEENVSTITESLTNHMDEYLSYVVEEWMQENKLAVENGFRTEIAENFMMGLKELFENSFIDVPEEKYDVLDDLFTVNSELESHLNESIKENMELKNKVLAHECAESFVELSRGLADTEVEKLAKLSENIEFNSVDQYRDKIQLLKESYFGAEGTPENTGNLLTEETTDVNRKPAGVDTTMDAYIHSISNQLKLTNRKTAK
jgi:hypothetical protein